MLIEICSEGQFGIMRHAKIPNSDLRDRFVYPCLARMIDSFCDPSQNLGYTCTDICSSGASCSKLCELNIIVNFEQLAPGVQE